MALVVQQVDVDQPRLWPLDTRYSEPNRWRTSEPFARIVIPLADQTLNAPGSGDSFQLSVKIRLPEGNAYQVTRFAADLTYGGNKARQASGALTQYVCFAPPPGFDYGSTVETRQTLAPGIRWENGTSVGVTFGLGGGSQDGGVAADYVGSAFTPFLPYVYGYGDTGVSISADFFGNTNTTLAGTFNFYLELLAYNTNQLLTSELFWRVPVEGG